jgi:hypothetical protein
LILGGGYQSAGRFEALNDGPKVIIVGLFVQLIFFGIFIVVALAFHRSVFRAVEYLQGFDGYFLENQIYLYIFDAVLMLLVMVLFSYHHRAEILAITSQRGNMYGI